MGGGIAFAENTTFVINSVVHHLNLGGSDAVMVSDLQYGMTSNLCKRGAARPGGPQIVTVCLSHLLADRLPPGEWNLGLRFEEAVAGAYREAAESARKQGLDVKLVVLEQVLSAPSCVMPCAAPAEAVKAVFPAVWVCVDGAHAMGALPIDLAGDHELRQVMQMPRNTPLFFRLFRAPPPHPQPHPASFLPSRLPLPLHSPPPLSS